MSFLERKRGERVRIFVAGTFDIIHVGHIRFLYAAKRLARNSELIVVVARDKTVERLKGRKPVFNELERLEIVSALKPVDKAVLGYESENIFEILKEIRPDIVVLGYDQRVSEKELICWAQMNGLSFRVLRLPKFDASISSSSEARRRIMRK